MSRSDPERLRDILECIEAIDRAELTVGRYPGDPDVAKIGRTCPELSPEMFGVRGWTPHASQCVGVLITDRVQVVTEDDGRITFTINPFSGG